MSRPHIVIERNIPFIAGILDPYADIDYLAAPDITPEAMRDADALVTRTRTRCDASLLDGSRCRLIATATIGTDHIDLPYCRERGITVANAPGCNAPAVAQYVYAAIFMWLRERGDTRRPADLTLGIVGVGNVGRIVERWGRELGFRVLLCDPPRAAAEGADAFVDIDTIAAESDIITFHTPLTRTGDCPTAGLCDSRLLAVMRRRPLLINSSRGPVVDNAALVGALDSGAVADAVIDCWEGEPQISPALHFQYLCIITQRASAGPEFRRITDYSIGIQHRGYNKLPEWKCDDDHQQKQHKRFQKGKNSFLNPVSVHTFSPFSCSYPFHLKADFQVHI